MTEMKFGAAKRVVEEELRKGQSWEKLRDVLEAADRADKKLKSLPDQMSKMEAKLKGLAGKKKELENEIAVLAASRDNVDREWSIKNAEAKKGHEKNLADYSRTESQIRRNLDKLESSLDKDYKTKKAKANGVVDGLHKQIKDLEGKRDSVKQELSALQDRLASVIGGTA